MTILQTGDYRMGKKSVKYQEDDPDSRELSSIKKSTKDKSKKKKKKKNSSVDSFVDSYSTAHAVQPGNSAAFFDVDNTLVQGASIVHLARGLARQNYFGYSELMGFVWQQVKFRVVGKENSHDMNAGKEQALSFIKGRKVQELSDLGEELYQECIGERLWEPTCKIAHKHIEVGRQVWLVTATPRILAQTIAKQLDLTGALGTEAEDKDGVFTGNLVTDILHGQAKADAIMQLAREHNIDLLSSYAYSDSYNDLPMLNLVGHPVAINPDPQLREHAKNHDWEMHDFRAGRRAARIGVPALLLGAASAGSAVAVRYSHTHRK